LGSTTVRCFVVGVVVDVDDDNFIDVVNREGSLNWEGWGHWIGAGSINWVASFLEV
jgi:hypothetical protein